MVSERAGLLRTAAPKDEHAEQRHKLIDELVSTEEVYVTELQFITKVRISALFYTLQWPLERNIYNFIKIVLFF